MHRILNIAGNEKNKDDLIEQPAADFIFITSVKADLKLISKLLLEKEFASLNGIHLPSNQAYGRNSCIFNLFN